jgi:hypothetical protein
MEVQDSDSLPDFQAPMGLLIQGAVDKGAVELREVSILEAAAEQAVELMLLFLGLL